MVDSNPQSGYRSLSADSELSSAYNYLRNGEYKQCRRTIEKKLPKLKSELDKVNFNIVKLLLLNKTKKLKESKKQIEMLKKDFTTSQALISNQELRKYFIGILRELDEEQTANEIYKNSIKNLNLAKLPNEDQSDILKQLTQNFDFAEVYSKINAFLKIENNPDKKFLTLLKYEIIYILSFRLGKISKTIVNLTLKEMINNYDTLSKEKGFIDILIKYLISLNDSNTFLKLFENQHVEFTNAPLKDFFVSIYLEKGEDEKIIDYIIKEILENLNEWNFLWYERLVNFIFFVYKEKLEGKKGVPDSEKFWKFVNETKESIEQDIEAKNFSIKNIDDFNHVLSQVYNLFNLIQIKLADRKTNLNAYKSAILAKLMLFHQIILWKGDFEIYSEIIFGLILEILEISVNKQSIIHEASKFFIYLTNPQRSEILSRFVYKTDTASPSMIENYNLSEKEKIIFFHKLEKLLIGNLFSQELKSLLLKIDQLTNLYFNLSNNQPKLEKGERLIGDDIIILINEYFSEFTNIYKENEILQNESYIRLAYSLFSLNSLALERSPYNYDISIYSLRIAGTLNLPGKVLEILKYMNLKGPQFETVSYIAFPYFLNTFYKPGLNYIAESIEKWEKDNKKSIRSTLWKMFTGRNFWNSEDLLHFLTQNEDSYYKYLIKFIDLLKNFNENLTFKYEDENVFKEIFEEYTEILFDLENKFHAKIKSGSINMNQDLIISLLKYKYVKFFDGNYPGLAHNRNFDTGNYRFKIDSLSKNNMIYELYPSYKNNYLIQDDVEVFGIFDHTKFLLNRIINKINFSVLAGNVPTLSGNIKEIRENYLTSEIELMNLESFNQIPQIDSIERKLFGIYTESENNLEFFIKNEEEILKSFSELKEKILDKISENRMSYGIFDSNSKIIFNKNFNFLTNFNLFNIVTLTSKFLDLINDNKKALKEIAGASKIKINNSFKSPILNMFTDNITGFENILNKINHSDVIEYFYSSFSVLSEETHSNMISNKNFIQELATKFVDEQKDQLKNLIEMSKLLRNYVKENI